MSSNPSRPILRREARKIIRTALRQPPVLIQELPGAELWGRGQILFVLPVIEDRYGDDLKEALARRRTAALTGRCPCGARQRVKGVSSIELQHLGDCRADDLSIEQMLREAQ